MSAKEYGLYDAGNDVDDIKCYCERLQHLLQILTEITDSEYTAMVELGRRNKTLEWVAGRMNVKKALIDVIHLEAGNVVQEIDNTSRRIWEAFQRASNSQTFANLE